MTTRPDASAFYEKPTAKASTASGRPGASEFYKSDTSGSLAVRLEQALYRHVASVVKKDNRDTSSVMAEAMRDPGWAAYWMLAGDEVAKTKTPVEALRAYEIRYKDRPEVLTAVRKAVALAISN